MDRPNSVPRGGSTSSIPLSQPQSYRPTAGPQQFSSSQMKFMNDLVQQQPPSQRQAVNKQLEQLSPEQINEIQRKLENGEILHGLPNLPEGANMTHKFIVKVRKHNNQPSSTSQPKQPPPTLPPRYVPQCNPENINYEMKLKQQDERIEQLLVELNRMSQFLVEKSNEIEIWKKQYLSIQQELSKPKVIDNSDKYLKEINDLKDQLAQKDYELQMHETTIKQLQENQNEEIELRAGNNEDDIEQLKQELYDTRQDLEMYKEDNDRLNRKLETLESEQLNKKKEVTTVYRADPETDRKLKELQTQYTLLQSQYYSLQIETQNYQKEVHYETKIVYQPDPEVEAQLEELKSRYRLLESQFRTLQETSKIVQKEIQYETKVIYQPDQETERLLEQKIEQYNQLQIRYSQLQQQYYQLEDRSKITQKEIQYETKIIYQPDPETERLLRLKTQQLEQMESKCTILQQQIETTRIQISQYETKIYQFESRNSDSQNYLIQIEQLKEQIRRLNADIEQYTRKIYQLESTNEQSILIMKQNSDLKSLYEEEQQLTLQLKRRIEDLKVDQQSNESYSYKIRELDSLLQQREDRIRQLTLEIDQYRSDIQTYQQRMSSIQINIENSNSLKDQLQLWKEKYEQLEIRQRNATSEEVTQWKIRFEQLEQRYISLEQSYQTIQITLNEYKDNEEDQVLKLEIKRLQKTVIDLRSEIDRLLVQASDNQWLSKRYEEQQLLIEQYKAQLEQRQSVSKEYTYEIINPKSEQFSTSQKIVKATSAQQISAENQSIYPVQQQTRTYEYNEFSSIQPRVSEVNNYSTRQVDYFSGQQQRLSSQQNQFLVTTQNNFDETRRSRAEQEFNSQRWNNNYETVVEEVTRMEKRFS